MNGFNSGYIMNCRFGEDWNKIIFLNKFKQCVTPPPPFLLHLLTKFHIVSPNAKRRCFLTEDFLLEA